MIEPFLPDAGHLIFVLLLATGFDLLIGEPPTALHPVVWIGNLIGFFKKKVPATHKKAYGVVFALIVILFAASIAYVVLLIANLSFIPEFVVLLIEAYFLKSTFAIRRLLEAAMEVYGELEKGDLVSARKKLSMYVSRDTSQLTESQVSSSVIETCSENFVDGILSPLFYYVIFGPYGLIGAYIFKAVSTLDSMVGYMNEKYRDIGYFSAKTDDVLNWIPARICVVFIMAGSFLSSVLLKSKGLDHIGAFRCASTDCMTTPSPNSGYPMAAIAGALGVRLEKPNTYVIGKGLSLPKAEDIKKAAEVIGMSSILVVIIFVALIYIISNLINYL
ncbi:cobalamin biosynthesis protein [Methanococcoides alaskense]|uniref:Probable cobalamin biosynthesis protein CobD n=1 Tax=Methanococcoides alaskense TaxID=325778 RepID=A0AA90ZC06_9EURY|nr:cobalamin biosynthesis protein [Methanococcoides alaskense]MDA0524037.1 cobalamin biosynthesis protein [Methanococcoides alaskense]MDR6222487.1 adenosylcobinamide-phosphate synthase [Methanococcoides alaskense]